MEMTVKRRGWGRTMMASSHCSVKGTEAVILRVFWLAFIRMVMSYRKSK